MENPNNIKRKHFRFPVYDDAIGVKLVSGEPRDWLRGEPILTQVSENDTMAPSFSDTDLSEKQISGYQEKREKDWTNNQLTYSKAELPNYMMQKNKVHAVKEKKRGIFDNQKNTSVYQSGGHSFDKNAFSLSKNTKSTNQIQSTRFVPKNIPASIIQEDSFGSVSEELAASMKRDKSNYLLFDDEPTAFQVKKKEEDATVKKFNVPKESPDIPVTRRQYQQIKPNMQKFSKEELSHSLPRSRKELKSAKENVNTKSSTAYGQKVTNTETEDRKKEARMDKSLSGIIKESNSELDKSKYFN